MRSLADSYKCFLIYKYLGVIAITSFIVAIGIIIPIIVARINSRVSRERMTSLLGKLNNEGTVDYTNAVKIFQHPDKMLLQRIVAQTKYLGSLEKSSNYIAAANGTYDLHKAFEIAGTNLSPIRSDFESEFLSGDSVSSSGWGLVTIGGFAWKTLLMGLTNSNLRVRICAVEAMQYANSENAAIALPVLASFLTNSPEELRIQTVDIVGRAEIDSNIKKGLLIYTVQTETNLLIKCMAIKALGHAGVYDGSVQAFLQRIDTNQSGHIRAAVATALKELNNHSTKY